MKIFLRLLKIIKPFWKEILYSILLGSLTIGSGIALLATSSFLISMAALHTSIADLQVAIVGVRFFGISRGVFRYIERFISHSVNFKILVELRITFFKSLLPIIPVRSREIQSGELLGRVVSDVEALQDFFVRVIAPPFISIIVSSFYLLFLGYYSIHLAVIFGLIYVISGIILPLIVVKISSRYEKERIKLKSDLSQILIETVQGLNELIMLRKDGEQKNMIKEINSKIAELQTKSATISTLNSSLSAFFTNFGPWIVLLLVIPLVESQAINGVMLAVLVLSSFASFEIISQLSLSAEYLQKSLNSAERIFEITDLVDVDENGEHNIEIDSLELISIRDMGFTYSKDERFALKGINFDLEYGKKIAIVGPSGAGKTTLINILMGYWDKSSGNYEINEVDADSIKKDSLNEIYSFCEQDAYIFAGSLKANLTFEDDSISLDRIENALEIVQLQELISSLPEGLDTWVGEHGKAFSAGEIQRIHLARTLLKDSQVLIFDEPTSNLDAINEREIIHMITNLDEEKSIILITHRLKGMQEMDEILYLDNGEIIERGTHKELIRNNGDYAKIWEIQQQLIKSD